MQLVVATALGLLVTAAVVSLYALQRRIVTHLEATRRLYDAGQQALEALTVHARLAGFTDAERFGAAMTPRPVAPRGIFGCDNARVVDTVDERCEPTRDDSDGVVFRHAADTVSTTVSSAGNPIDCLGQNVAGAEITVRFYAGFNKATGQPELYCKGNGEPARPQPLVEGVEQLRLRYWLPGAAAPVRASSVSREEWARIAALDICVVVRGPSAGRRVSYVDCDGIPVSPGDRRMRAAFMRRVALRNVGVPNSSISSISRYEQSVGMNDPSV